MTTFTETPEKRLEMNVTPLIDVLLVLLITFLVITPLMSKGLPAAIPQAAPAGTRVSEPAIVLELLGVTTPNVKNRALRNSDHSLEAAKGRRGLNGKVSAMTLSLQYVFANEVRTLRQALFSPVDFCE